LSFSGKGSGPAQDRRPSDYPGDAGRPPPRARRRGPKRIMTPDGRFGGPIIWWSGFQSRKPADPKASLTHSEPNRTGARSSVPSRSDTGSRQENASTIAAEGVRNGKRLLDRACRRAHHGRLQGIRRANGGGVPQIRAKFLGAAQFEARRVHMRSRNVF